MSEAGTWGGVGGVVQGWGAALSGSGCRVRTAGGESHLSRSPGLPPSAAPVIKPTKLSFRFSCISFYLFCLFLKVSLTLFSNLSGIFKHFICSRI